MHLIAEIFLEVILLTCCGWLGHWVIRILTFGKVRLDYGRDSSSFLSDLAGISLLLSIGIFIWMIT